MAHKLTKKLKAEIKLLKKQLKERKNNECNNQ